MKNQTFLVTCCLVALLLANQNLVADIVQLSSDYYVSVNGTLTDTETRNFFDGNGAYNLYADQSQSITDGTQNFDWMPPNSFSTLYASASYAVTGGTQNFAYGSVLEANAANAIDGGTQNFVSASLRANASDAISNGTQNFAYGSSLTITTDRVVIGGTQNFSNGNGAQILFQWGEYYDGAITGGTQNFYGGGGPFDVVDVSSTRAITGGTQNFYSAVDVSRENAITGGVQNVIGPVGTMSVTATDGIVGTYVPYLQAFQSITDFYGNTVVTTAKVLTLAGSATLEVSAQRSITGTRIALGDYYTFGSSQIDIQADQALDRTVDLVFDYNEGGTVNLNGHDLTVGALWGGHTGDGFISNAGAATPSTLVLDFDRPPNAFMYFDSGVRIEDGLNGAAVSVIKRGTGLELLTAGQGYTGSTTVENGVLAVSFGPQTPQQNTISTAALTLSGGGLEIRGPMDAGNNTVYSQSFSGLTVGAGASALDVKPNTSTSLAVNLGNFANLTRVTGGTMEFRVQDGYDPQTGFLTPNVGSVAFSNVVSDTILPWASLNYSSFVSLEAGVTSQVTALTDFDTTRNGVDFHSGAGLLQFSDAASQTATNLNGEQFNAVLVAFANPGGNNTDQVNYTRSTTQAEELIFHQHNANNAAEFSYDITLDGNAADFLLTKTGAGTLIVGGLSRRVVNNVTSPANISLQVNEGDVIANLDIAGDVILKNGGGLGGNANVNGLVKVGGGGRLVPGNSPGTVTAGTAEWDGGGTYVWEINDATGTAGLVTSGWDVLNVTGELEITATFSNPFVIDLHTLTLGNVAGDMANFDPYQDFTWTIATADAGITGFIESAFTLNKDNFDNTFDALNSQFSLALGNGDTSLNLVYTYFGPPIPEPSTGLLVAAGILIMRLARRRRAC